jgi:hypothetical protein
MFATDKEALYATFPRTPAAFSNVLAFWLLRLSEMNQANFVGESINEPLLQCGLQQFPT